MPRRMAFDRWLFFTTGLLVVAGIFMVGSASHYFAVDHKLPSHYYMVKQLVHAAVGLVLLLVLMHIPYRSVCSWKVVLPALVVCIAALVVVLAMPPIGGARRWLVLSFLRVQPSEAAKLIVVLFMARILSQKEKQVNDFFSVPLPCFCVLAPMVLLIIIEPDLGGAMMLMATACIMIFVAGLKWRYVFATGGMAALVLVLGIVAQPYRWRRVMTFFSPDVDSVSEGWQLAQSLVAIGSGGLLGAGFGKGQQKAFFLPEAHTDFIYSVIGEELGVIGTGMVLLGFLVLMWRGLRTALRAPDSLGFYLALGVTSLLVFQGLIHMGVCVGLFPTKGMALPFISYGGSSLLISMAATGILLNVSQHSN